MDAGFAHRDFYVWSLRFCVGWDALDWDYRSGWREWMFQH